MARTPMDRKTWVLQMIEAARPTAEKIGISPEAIVAQAALESGWGEHAIGNNMFGIKADSEWIGKTQTVRTREVDPSGNEYYIDAAFRDYDDKADSVADHFRFLDENSRYRRAGVFDRKGDEHYFKSLQKAGYATDPNYAERLVAVKRSVQQIAGQPVTRVLCVDDRSTEVLALQKALNDPKNGDYMLEEDGFFGGLTSIAVKDFQQKHNLVVDGIAGEQTLKALRL